MQEDMVKRSGYAQGCSSVKQYIAKYKQDFAVLIRCRTTAAGYFSYRV